MSRSSITTAVAIVVSFSVGLTWSYMTSHKTGSVAIVDLDEVAKRLGQDKEMTESLQNQGGRLQTQLATAQNQLVQDLKQKQVSLGDEYTQEEAQQFVRTRNAYQLKLNQLQQQAQVVLGQTRQQLISDFRSRTQPIAAKIAKEKGFDTVVTRNDSVVFSYDNSVDITDDVVKLMSAEFPVRPASTTPAPAEATPTPAEPQIEPTTETAETPTETTTN